MNIKNFYKPDKAFLERTRHAYLLHYHSRYPHPARAVSTFGYFIRGAAVAASFVLVLSGVAAYADVQNVGPSSLLYPLKRTYESVDLLLASDAKKSELHVQFAERRLSEIQEIEQEKPQSPQVHDLTADFKKEIKSTLSVLESPAPRKHNVQEAPQENVSSTIQENRELQQESRTLRHTKPSTGQNLYPTVPGASTSLEQGQVVPGHEGSATEPMARQEDQELLIPTPPINNIAPVCDSLRGFLNRRGDEVRKVLNDGKELFEKYKTNCEQGSKNSDGGAEQKPTRDTLQPGLPLNTIKNDD